ncbi:MAG: hypothetical protein ACAH59_07590 [Pseudobdellovibrionaceae bacterium]
MKSFFKGLSILIFAIVFGACLGCFSVVFAAPQAYLTMPISVAVLSGEDKAVFDEKVAPLLKDGLKSCSGCSFQNITPYTPEGKIALAEVPTRLETAGSSSSFVYIHWNAKVSDETRPILESLKKLTQNGLMVIGAAGLAKDQEPTLSLNKTVLGQVAGLIIIGELEERERMLNRGYFGPEMLTALRPPKDYMGQGYASLFFASRLATQWNRKSSKEWALHFQTTKSKVRRIWPEIDDFFGRR